MKNYSTVSFSESETQLVRLLNKLLRPNYVFRFAMSSYASDAPTKAKEALAEAQSAIDEYIKYRIFHE